MEDELIDLLEYGLIEVVEEGRGKENLLDGVTSAETVQGPKTKSCWGEFVISEVYSNLRGNRERVGYGALCGKHWNVGDQISCKCKQQLTIVGLSASETLARIKMWCLAGRGIDDNQDSSRTKHLNCKPLRFALLPDAEIERRLASGEALTPAEIRPGAR